MYGNVNANFHLFLDTGFLYPEVEEIYRDYFKDSELPYASIMDFINSTIVGITPPEIEDIGSKEQYHMKGMDKKSYSGSLQIVEEQDFDVHIKFNAAHNYLNYYILLLQHLTYNDHKKVTRDRVFMPGGLFLQVTDDDDNVLHQTVYKELQFRKLTSPGYLATGSGFSYEQFDVVIKANGMDLIIDLNKVTNDRL
jgi:hypothetical protein